MDTLIFVVCLTVSVGIGAGSSWTVVDQPDWPLSDVTEGNKHAPARMLDTIDAHLFRLNTIH